eukprot:gnl/Hemi2/10317_TR3556_c0_g2_i1.p1 gnl/Hemi2/10317_TR3556_c0_g2~~gnl/Hemi2/10317_TR3556_c0_g2_i1.p1  ORF type:complete len:237 (-),score=45.32 gnl/Hemi2/10317_TR3556_c0_g2_i1:52-762(-)
MSDTVTMHESCNASAGPFYYDSRALTLSQARLLQSICDYYTPERLQLLVACTCVAAKRKQPSCRTLFWLVTSYSKSHPVIVKNADEDLVNVHQDYLRMQRLHKSQGFGVFARGKVRLYYRDGADEEAEEGAETPGGRYRTTTLAQLNFFRWADLSGVLDFARENKKLLRQHQRSLSQDSQEESDDSGGKPKKRKPMLSEPSSSVCNVLRMTVTLQANSSGPLLGTLHAPPLKRLKQ